MMPEMRGRGRSDAQQTLMTITLERKYLVFRRSDNKVVIVDLKRQAAAECRVRRNDRAWRRLNGVRIPRSRPGRRSRAKCRRCGENGEVCAE